jgi:uncharacterized membrane protein
VVRLPAWLAGAATGEVVIRCPIHDVYGFYRNFANLPLFLGDVVAVERLTDTTSRWTVTGPFAARIPMTVTITEQRVDQLLRYRTGGPGPLGGHWELAFAVDVGTGGTRIREQIVVPLGPIGRAALTLLGKFPQREIAANLTRLKQLLETPHGNATPSAAGRASAARPQALPDHERGTR